MKVIVSLSLSLMTVLMLSGTPAHAQATNDKDKPIDKAQAAQRAQQQVNGRVLKVERVKNNGKYRVKVLQKSGRVVSVDVDRRSGKVTATKAKEKDK